VQGGSDYEIDARPSDAIALAVRVSAPIFATEAVLDRAGVVPEADENEKLSVFRDFVNSLGTDTPPPGGFGALGGSGGAATGDAPPDSLTPDDPPPDEPPVDDRRGGGAAD